MQTCYRTLLWARVYTLNFTIFIDTHRFLIILQSQEEKSYSKWDKGRQRESKVSELSEYQVLEQTYHNVSTKNF